MSTKSKLRLGGDVRRFVRIRKEAAPPVNRLFCPDFRADRSQFLRHRSSSLFYYLATFFKKRSNDGGPFFFLFSSLLLLREREKFSRSFEKYLKNKFDRRANFFIVAIFFFLPSSLSIERLNVVGPRLRRKKWWQPPAAGEEVMASGGGELEEKQAWPVRATGRKANALQAGVQVQAARQISVKRRRKVKNGKYIDPSVSISKSPYPSIPRSSKQKLVL